MCLYAHLEIFFTTPKITTTTTTVENIYLISIYCSFLWLVHEISLSMLQHLSKSLSDFIEMLRYALLDVIENDRVVTFGPFLLYKQPPIA